MPLLTLQEDIQINKFALPDWQRFRLATHSMLGALKDWQRVEPDFLNYRIIGWAFAISERYELVEEKDHFILSKLTDKHSGWRIFFDGKVVTLDGVVTPNPAIPLYKYEWAKNHDAWAAFNSHAASLTAKDIKIWLDQNNEIKRYIEYPFSLAERYLANPIYLALELMASPGLYVPVKSISERFKGAVEQTILNAYRQHLNFIDQGE